MGIPTEAVLAEYEEWLRSWATGKTVKLRMTLARAALTEWGGVENVSRERITEYLGRPNRDGKPKSNWSKATYHGHFKSLCEFLRVAGYLNEDLMEGVRSPRRPKGVPKALLERDVSRVLDAAQGDVHDWIVVALCTGLRVSEVARLRGEDVSSEGVFVTGKGDVTVNLPAHPDVLEIATRKPVTGYWWPGRVNGHVSPGLITDRVGALFRELGIPTGSIHRCRHSYGTRLIRAGVSVRTVQKLMRHSSLETTANYAAVDQDELQAGIMVLPSSVRSPEPPAAA